MIAYHGTSSLVARRLLADRPLPRHRIFTSVNRSLGGTYVTSRRDLAAVYARGAARTLGGAPVVLVLHIRSAELLPDEDWVVAAAEARHGLALRTQRFMHDLFVGYPGGGTSLSDHYKRRYKSLNRRHAIDWRYSWRWCGTARLPRPLCASDIFTVEPL